MPPGPSFYLGPRGPNFQVLRLECQALWPTAPSFQIKSRGFCFVLFFRMSWPTNPHDCVGSWIKASRLLGIIFFSVALDNLPHTQASPTQCLLIHGMTVWGRIHLKLSKDLTSWAWTWCSVVTQKISFRGLRHPLPESYLLHPTDYSQLYCLPARNRVLRRALILNYFTLWFGFGLH